MNYFRYRYYLLQAISTCLVCVKETYLRDVSLTHTKHMFDRETTDNNLFRGRGLYIRMSTSL